MKPTDELLPIGAVLGWPHGVADFVGVSAVSLQRCRANGDSPKLYALTERHLVTTVPDVVTWVRAKAVPPDYKCRPATRRSGGSK